MERGTIVTATKNAIRVEALRRRDALPPEERAAASLAICQAVMGDDLFMDARGIHVYCRIGSEVDIQPLVDVAWELGKEVGMMVVMEDGGTVQYRITPETVFRAATKLRIQEPVDASPFDMNSCDLVIVPLVAADERCNRLGYGKGYYDQFLTHFPRPTIGVGFDAQIFPELPTDDRDIALDKVYTESRLIDGNCEE